MGQNLSIIRLRANGGVQLAQKQQNISNNEKRCEENNTNNRNKAKEKESNRRWGKNCSLEGSDKAVLKGLTSVLRSEMT